MHDIHIRLADLPDAPAIAALIRALDNHYGGEGNACPIDQILAMVQASMTSREGTRYALAIMDGQAVGLACFVILRPGFRLSGLMFLKELFVESQIRGRAVGAALMNWLADYARSLGLTRIDLTTDGQNTGAQTFYERLGADRMDKVFYRFNLSTEVLRGD